MISGSLNTNKYDKIYNFQIFRQSMLDVLTDAGFDVGNYDEDAVNAVIVVILKNLMGNKKLKDYMSDLIPTRQDLN